MQLRSVLILSFIFCLSAGSAQLTPSEIKYRSWNIHALRYYPLSQPADSFMIRVIERNQNLSGVTFENHYEKIAVDLTMNKQFLADKISRPTLSSSIIYKQLILPYGPWLGYARPIRENSPDLNLTLFLSERFSKENQPLYSSDQTPLDWIGAENIRYYLEEWLGEIDIWKEQNEVLFLPVKSPIAENAGATYRYFFSSHTEIDGIPVYEIVFYSRKIEENAFEGYLYVSTDDLSIVKVVFTLNPRLKKSPANAVLFTQTPSKKETLLSIGGETSAGLLVEHTRFKGNELQDSTLANFRTMPQKEISGLMEEAQGTRAYSNLKTGLSFLLTDRIGIFNDKFNLGPISHMVSYNYMEGFRLRIGGFTSQKVNRQAAIGGYVAYGTKDEQWKYRGDFVFSPFSTGQFHFTYVNDLNIPGYNCLEDKRDRIYYSLSHYKTTNMSLQRIGQISYETSGLSDFSVKLHTKYTYDEPLGVVKYEKINNGTSAAVNSVTTTETGLAFRYAPNEKVVHIQGKRIVFRSPDVDFRLSHRVGVKGIFNSGFNYHITDFSALKSFGFPMNKGSIDIRLSGGKVWNPVPFPLLFIPAGNQSYIFDTNKYNLMHFYEFITDRFVAGSTNVRLNWSPVRLFFPKNTLKTHAGIKAIYGPLSDMNNPRLHPELFIFSPGVKALGEKPYTEAHIGISGILKILRIDYVHRLTHKTRGSLFFSANLNL
jgi:hypothetical protein